MSKLDKDYRELIRIIAAEKGITEDAVFTAMENAIARAAEKHFNSTDVYGTYKAEVNRSTGTYTVYSLKTVVEEVEEEDLEISLEEARRDDPNTDLGDMVMSPETIDDGVLGRIASQAAKQVLLHDIREAERERIYNEFIGRLGEVTVAEVKRYEKNNVYLDIDRVEAILRRSDCLKGERFDKGNRIKVVIVAVDRAAKDAQVQVSRTDPRLLVKLFENEVPEIHDGVVVISNCVREAGDRAKVAVRSYDSDVDPVGACVGLKGSRVQAIIRELQKEKIDIVRYDEDPRIFIANALNPAKTINVTITDEVEQRVEVLVEDDQLSIAIGKRGQNVRLAAKLTGWNIDVRSKSEPVRQTAGSQAVADALPESSS